MTPTVCLARLRMANRLLVAAANADEGLLTDDNWLKALSSVVVMLNKAETAASKHPEHATKPATKPNGDNS